MSKYLDSTGLTALWNKIKSTFVAKESGKGLFSGSYNDLTNKPTIPSISGLESTSNKITSISSSSTDTQYPSAKAVYDYIQSLDSNNTSY